MFEAAAVTPTSRAVVSAWRCPNESVSWATSANSA